MEELSYPVKFDDRAHRWIVIERNECLVLEECKLILNNDEVCMLKSNGSIEPTFAYIRAIRDSNPELSIKQANRYAADRIVKYLSEFPYERNLDRMWGNLGLLAINLDDKIKQLSIIEDTSRRVGYQTVAYASAGTGSRGDDRDVR
jgi:hypothetical protein